MTTASKTLRTAKPKADWKTLITFTFDKIYENVTEAFMTLVTLAITLAYLNAMKSLTGEFALYIALVFLFVMMIRLIHDFDDSFTNDELGALVNTILAITKDLYRLSSSDNVMITDEELDHRFSRE